MRFRKHHLYKLKESLFLDKSFGYLNVLSIFVKKIEYLWI